MPEMKIVTEKNINGEDQLVVITTPSYGNQGAYAGVMVDAGKPYWAWPSIPAGQVIGCNFAGAPIINKSDPSANLAAIAAIEVEPGDVLTYMP